MKYSLFAIACVIGLVFADEDDERDSEPAPSNPAPSPSTPGSATGAPLIPAGSAFALLINTSPYTCPVTADSATGITTAINLVASNPSSIQIGCTTSTPSTPTSPSPSPAPTSKKLLQTGTLDVGVVGTLQQLSNLQQAIQAGLLAPVGIPSTSSLTWIINGVPAVPPPNVPFSVPFNSTLFFGPCIAGATCPTTGCTGNAIGGTWTNVPTYFNLFCTCVSCSTTSSSHRAANQLATAPVANLLFPSLQPLIPGFNGNGVRAILSTQDCNGVSNPSACSAAVAEAFACYVLHNNFPSALQTSIRNGQWYYTVPGSANPVQFTYSSSQCPLSSSSSKKGLLGLLGLLGLIPLILCCCLLLLCCLRKRKAGPDVHFATFDAGAPAMLPSTGIPPVGACYPSVVGVSPHAPSLVV